MENLKSAERILSSPVDKHSVNGDDDKWKVRGFLAKLIFIDEMRELDFYFQKT